MATKQTCFTEAHHSKWNKSSPCVSLHFNISVETPARSGYHNGEGPTTSEDQGDSNGYSRAFPWKTCPRLNASLSHISMESTKVKDTAVSSLVASSPGKMHRHIQQAIWCATLCLMSRINKVRLFPNTCHNANKDVFWIWTNLWQKIGPKETVFWGCVVWQFFIHQKGKKKVSWNYVNGRLHPPELCDLAGCY